MTSSNGRPTAKWFALLPVAALVVFAGTLARCWAIARDNGRLEYFISYGVWPDISVLGIAQPEHTWFGGGFSLLGVVMLGFFAVRYTQLRGAAPVARSTARRVTNHVLVSAGFLSIGCLLVMAWIPADASPVHFFAALAAFGLLAIYELAHAALCASFVREGTLGVPMLAWSFVCPFGVVAGVVLWIVKQSALWQYGAVALLFAYFLPMSFVLTRPASLLAPGLVDASGGQRHGEGRAASGFALDADMAAHAVDDVARD
jgi:hypothetical protein